MFDMPLEKLGLIERNLFRMARAASTEKLPSATLCYVWDDKLSPETMLSNAYTSRVRLIVTTSGAQQPGQWVKQSRDIAADFRRAFAAESDTLPPLWPSSSVVMLTTLAVTAWVMSMTSG